MIIKTETGSRYEINSEDKQIRRLSGVNDPTARQGKDGEWKTYSQLSEVEVGKSITIIWNGDVPLLEGSPEGSLRTTVTSYVVEIE